MTTVDLQVGSRVRLAPDRRRWWTIKAVSEHFAVATRQVEFRPKGVLCYTVLDWRNGVRGPCNLIGQGWGDGSYSEAECAEMLIDFENYDRLQAEFDKHPMGESFSVDYHALEVSHRNRVGLEILETK